MRRFTRLTNAFSKKVENHAAAIALYFMYYNCGAGASDTPRDTGDGSGVANHVWNIEEIVTLVGWRGGEKMRVLRQYLGLAIMLAVPPLGGAVLRLTNDIALRFMLLPVFLALAGAGFALMWFNGREPSN